MIQLNKNIVQLKPSATLAINQEVKKLRKEGKTIYHFGFGQSPFKIHYSITEELKKHTDNNHYLPSVGLPALKKEISSFLSKHQGLNFNPTSIFVGPGSKELLYQLIYLLEGIFFIPQASWVSYVPQIKSKGASYKIIETNYSNNYKLTAEKLEKACKANENVQKIIILNSPNNPSGAVYTNDELKEIASVCRVFDCIVLSDEIYSQVNFKENYSPSMAVHYPEKTIVFGGLSKVFSAGGYRLGFAAIPETMSTMFIPLQSFFSETFSAVSSPIQYAAIKAYQMDDELNEYINDCTQILKEISKYVYNSLEKIKIKSTYPQGAFYMLIDFEAYRNKLALLEINNAEDLCAYLLKKERIALLPGQDFYFYNTSLTCRLAFVDFDGDKVYKSFKEKKKIDSEFMKAHVSNIYNGLIKLSAFLSKI